MSNPNEFFYTRPSNRDENGQILLGSTRKEPTPVESQPTYVVMNPLAETIEEGNVIIERIRLAADELSAQIANEAAWRASLKEAESTYEMAEAEALAEIIVLATAKEGPLAGLATSSEAYKIVLQYERIKLRSGKLTRQWQSLERTRRNCEGAQVELRQAETQFSAMRKVCELKAALVKAATI